MQYKMSDLVRKTEVPKSTILYYIKEGLLPEAVKEKTNFHKYSDEHIELIKYIKYMKEEMGSSNEQIKIALSRKNDSFSTSFSMLTPLMNTLSGVDVNAKQYTKDEFIEHFEIDKVLLEQLLSESIISPINGVYTDKEASVLSLIENCIESGIEYLLIKKYVKHADELAKIELQMQAQLCSVRNDENFSTLWKIIFNTLFNTKEYIFNRATYRVFTQAIKDEIIAHSKH